jgi:hypothetical protein
VRQVKFIEAHIMESDAASAAAAASSSHEAQAAALGYSGGFEEELDAALPPPSATRHVTIAQPSAEDHAFRTKIDRYF